MFAVFKQSLRKTRTAILGWGVMLGGLGMLFIPFYDTIAKNGEEFQKLLDIYPKEILAFFGEGGMANFTTPEGFLSVEYFSFMPLVIGFFAVLAGSGLLAADEESGVLDLVAAQPVSRSALFWGRVLALIVSTAGMLTLGYAGIVLGTSLSVMDLDPIVAIRPFASMFGFLVFFGGLSLLLSMLLPSRQSAAMLSGITLVAGFFLNGLANINDSLAKFVPFFPQSYFQSDNWAESFKVDWFLTLAGFGLAFMLIAWWRFLQRDIRVGGEGSWQIAKLSKLFTRKAEAKG